MSPLADEQTEPQRQDVASLGWGNQDSDLGRLGPEARLLPSSAVKERCSPESLLGVPLMSLPSTVCSPDGYLLVFFRCPEARAALGQPAYGQGRPGQVGVEGPRGHLEPTALLC